MKGIDPHPNLALEAWSAKQKAANRSSRGVCSDSGKTERPVSPSYAIPHSQPPSWLTLCLAQFEANFFKSWTVKTESQRRNKRKEQSDQERKREAARQDSSPATFCKLKSNWLRSRSLVLNGGVRIS